MPIFTFTTLDDPLAINGTFATGINASGQVVGTYTTFNDPDAAGGDTLPDGINNLGQIAGTFNNFPVQELGFIKIGNSYPFIVYPLNSTMTILLVVISLVAGIALGQWFKILILVPVMSVALVGTIAAGIARADNVWSIALMAIAV